MASLGHCLARPGIRAGGRGACRTMVWAVVEQGGDVVSERKPAEMAIETWVERQIREAQERGAFDNLPGAGKPIPGIAEPDDEHW
jgi:hypothetical protein